MDIYGKKRNELLAETVIKGLKSRNMTGYYAKDKEEALKLALDLIPKGSRISMGGCTSAMEIGLVSALKEGDTILLIEVKWSQGRHCLRLTMRMFS